MTTTYRYVLNRLRLNGRCTDRVMLTRLGKSAEITTAQGIETGIRIENRGEKDARWSFVGQIDSTYPYLDNGRDHTDAEWRSLGLDLSRYGS